MEYKDVTLLTESIRKTASDCPKDWEYTPRKLYLTLRGITGTRDLRKHCSGIRLGA